MTYIGDMVPDRDYMADWKYAEENPGYMREHGLTAADLIDDYGDPLEPDLMAVVVEQNAADNAGIRAHNDRTTELRLRQENEELRALLKEHAPNVELPEED